MHKVRFQNVKFKSWEVSKLTGFLYPKTTKTMKTVWETWGLRICFCSPWRAYHCFVTIVTNMDWDEECPALRNKDCSRLFQPSCWNMLNDSYLELSPCDCVAFNPKTAKAVHTPRFAPQIAWITEVQFEVSVWCIFAYGVGKSFVVRPA